MINYNLLCVLCGSRLGRSAGMAVLAGCNQEREALTVTAGFLLAWGHVVEQIVEIERRRPANAGLEDFGIIQGLLPQSMHQHIPLLAAFVPKSVNLFTRRRDTRKSYVLTFHRSSILNFDLNNTCIIAVV